MNRKAPAFILFILFSLGAVHCSWAEDKNNLIAAVTFTDRSTGQEASLYELTGVFSKSEGVRYILGMEIRNDVLNQRFGRFGLIYTTRVRENKEASLEVDWWPGVDSNNEPWHIFLLQGELKTDAGLLMGLSYKGFIIPGDEMGIASAKAGYFNKTVMITGEFIHSLDWSPVTVSSFVVKAVYFTGPVSFTIGGSVGRTFISYAQLNIIRDTQEGFAGVSYAWNANTTFSLMVDKAYQEELHQDSLTAAVNYLF